MMLLELNGTLEDQPYPGFNIYDFIRFSSNRTSHLKLNHKLAVTTSIKHSYFHGLELPPPIDIGT